MASWWPSRIRIERLCLSPLSRVAAIPSRWRSSFSVNVVARSASRIFGASRRSPRPQTCLPGRPHERIPSPRLARKICPVAASGLHVAMLAAHAGRSSWPAPSSGIVVALTAKPYVWSSQGRSYCSLASTLFPTLGFRFRLRDANETRPPRGSACFPGRPWRTPTPAWALISYGRIAISRATGLPRWCH